MGGVEVLEHSQPFLEVRFDGQLDDLARRFGHETAHTGKLSYLRLRTAGAGMGHHINGVESIFVLFQIIHHDIGYLLVYGSPDVDDLVVALLIGNQAVSVLFIHLGNLTFGFFEVFLFLVGDLDVIHTYGDTKIGRIFETDFLNGIEHSGGNGRSVAVETVRNKRVELFLTHGIVEIPDLLGQYRVEHGPTGRCLNPLIIKTKKNLVMIVACLVLYCRNHFIHGAEELNLFLLDRRIILGEIVYTKHHVLSGTHDWEPICRIEKIL